MKLIEMLIDAFVVFFSPSLAVLSVFLRNYFWPEVVKRRKGLCNFYVFEKLTRARTTNCIRYHFVTYTKGNFQVLSCLWNPLERLMGEYLTNL